MELNQRRINWGRWPRLNFLLFNCSGFWVDCKLDYGKRTYIVLVGASGLLWGIRIKEDQLGRWPRSNFLPSNYPCLVGCRPGIYIRKTFRVVRATLGGVNGGLRPPVPSIPLVSAGALC